MESLLVGDTEKDFSLLERRLNDYLDGARELGFEGMSFVLDASHFIKSTSEEYFFTFESRINDIIEGRPCAFLCFYDFEGMDTSILKYSFNFYTHIFATNRDDIVKLRDNGISPLRT